MVAKRETPPKVEPPTHGLATAEAFEAWLADHRAEDAGQPGGIAEVDRAKADGRWARA